MESLENRKTFATNLQNLMDKNGISRNELCDAIGVKYPTLSGWLTAQYYPRIDKIETLARYFGVKKSDLVERQGSSYYIDKEAAELADFLAKNPQHKVLFDASRNVKAEDIEKVIAMINLMTGE